VRQTTDSVPEDRMEPPPPVQFHCPECGLSQEPATCTACGDFLCAHCDPDPTLHVACMPPEMIEDRVRAAHDCLLWFMRIRKAARKTWETDTYLLAKAAIKELNSRGIE
jgi:hypothetical protein